MIREQRYLVLGLEAGDPVRERLRVRYPDLRWTAAGAKIPLGGSTPEEILAECRRQQIRVLRSAVRSG